MKKLLWILLIMMSVSAIAAPNSHGTLAPYHTKKKHNTIDKSRILIGPGLGFGAAYRAFSFNISPSVAYCFTDHFHAGATLGFNYFQSTEQYTNPLTNMTETYKHKFPAYSMSIYGRYLLGNFLLLNVEPELNNTKIIDSYSYNWNSGKIIEKSSRLLVPSVLIGAGYTQHFNRYGYSFLMVCYDILQNPNARYYQTVDIKAGIMLDLWK
jgi:hypothetical protein